MAQKEALAMRTTVSLSHSVSGARFVFHFPSICLPLSSPPPSVTLPSLCNTNKELTHELLPEKQNARPASAPTIAISASTATAATASACRCHPSVCLHFFPWCLLLLASSVWPACLSFLLCFFLLLLRALFCLFFFSFVGLRVAYTTDVGDLGTSARSDV